MYFCVHVDWEETHTQNFDNQNFHI